METIKQMENRNQVVISTSENGKQSLPLNLVISLALGSLAGMALIIVLFLGANYIANI